MQRMTAVSQGSDGVNHQLDRFGGGVALEIEQVVMALSAALREAFNGLHRPATRAREVADVLQVDRPLASRLLRIAHAQSIADAIGVLPTVNQLQRSVLALSRLHPSDAAGRAVAATERFASLVAEVGGDQRSFESVVSQAASGGVPRVELAQRRAAYSANCHIWGVNVDCTTMLIAHVPGAQPGVLDGFQLRGFVGLRSRRPGETVRYELRARNGAGGTLGPSELLESHGNVTPASLREIPGSEGAAHSEIRLDGLRAADARTMYLRRRFSGVAWKDQSLRPLSIMVMVKLPTERLCLDLLVPHGMVQTKEVLVEAFADRENPLAAVERDPARRLRTFEKAILTPGISALPAYRHAPAVPAAFAQSVAQLGREGMSFDLFRCTIEYPVLHAAYALKVIPERINEVR